MGEAEWIQVGLNQSEYERLEREGHDPSFELRAYPLASAETRALLRQARGKIRRFLDSPLGHAEPNRNTQ